MLIIMGRAFLSQTLLCSARRTCNSRRHIATSTSPESAPANEPILDYLTEPKAKHRVELERSIVELANNLHEIPIVIGDKEYTSEQVRFQVLPYDKNKQLAKFYYAPQGLIHEATRVAMHARQSWQLDYSLEKRCAILEKAANLASGKYRGLLNAATMLGQAKTIKQAEIDAAAETVDFLRFNAHYARRLEREWQPRSTRTEQNRVRFRALDGFVAAITPFNFTAIGANLASAPALMGNGVVWKPSDTSMLSNYLSFKLLREAGVPPGVINFLPAEGIEFGRNMTRNKHLGGINFTGSLATFQWLCTEVGINTKQYEGFPRLIGECGGKNFHLIHKSAHLQTAVAQTVRSAFEYSGQKCSACSRLYVPESMWTGENGMRERLVAIVDKLKVGPATEFDSYTSALIDANSYARVVRYLDFAKQSADVEVVCGGQHDDKQGYFVWPTIVQVKDPRNRLMTDEIFGPILSVYVYADKELDETMKLIDDNAYALTGAIFAQDEQFIELAQRKLCMSAGNLYINDKSTGAVVGQQPFGGARLSGTNDKAGGAHYLMRWCNQQTIKRTTEHLTSH